MTQSLYQDAFLAIQLEAKSREGLYSLCAKVLRRQCGVSNVLLLLVVVVGTLQVHAYTVSATSSTCNSHKLKLSVDTDRYMYVD